MLLPGLLTSLFDRKKILLDEIRHRYAKGRLTESLEDLNFLVEDIKQFTFEQYTRQLGYQQHLSVKFSSIDNLVLTMESLTDAISREAVVDTAELPLVERVEMSLDEFLLTNAKYPIPIELAFDRTVESLRRLLRLLDEASLSSSGVLYSYYERITTGIRQDVLTVMLCFLVVSDQFQKSN